MGGFGGCGGRRVRRLCLALASGACCILRLMRAPSFPISGRFFPDRSRVGLRQTNLKPQCYALTVSLPWPETPQGPIGVPSGEGGQVRTARRIRSAACRSGMPGAALDVGLMRAPSFPISGRFFPDRSRVGLRQTNLKPQCYALTVSLPWPETPQGPIGVPSGEGGQVRTARRIRSAACRSGMPGAALDVGNEPARDKLFHSVGVVLARGPVGSKLRTPSA